MKEVAVRAARTMAQTAAGVIGTMGVLYGIAWDVVLSTTVLAGIVCVLMNLGDEEG